MSRFKKSLLLIIGILGLLLTAISSASASSANISHSYHITSNVTDGSIVSIDPSKTNYVEPANISNGTRLVGVTVRNNQSLIAIDSTNTTVQVATSGTVSTLVSNVNGNISVGDQIAASPFNGVGMKASPGQDVIGLAQSSFNAKSKGAQEQDVKNKDGQTSQIPVGYINLTIDPGIDQAGNDLSGVDKFAESLTGHKVSTIRVVISIIIAVVATISLIILIYASIYGTIISIGRNPLARLDIFGALGSVLLMTILMASVAGLTIYLLLL